MGRTFQIRISRLIDQKSVRTYVEVEAPNEVEALQKVIDIMRQASHADHGHTEAGGTHHGGR